MTRSRCLIWLGVLLVAIACQGDGPRASLPTETPLPSVTPGITETLPPTLTPTARPSPTATATPSISNFVRWERTASPPAHTFWSLTVSMAEPDVIYATTEHANVWRSTDGGRTWTQVGERGFGAHIFSKVAIHPFDSDILFTSNGILHVSRDGGKSWEGLFGSGDSLGVVSVTFAPSNPDVMYAGDDRARVYRSQDGGRTWKEAAALPSGMLTELWVAPQEPNIFLIGGAEGLFRSEDGGETFTQVLGRGVVQRSLTGDALGVVYVIRGDRLMRSTDTGLSWEPVPGVVSPVAVAAHGERLYVAVPGGVMRSVDGGASWEFTGYDPTELGTVSGLAIDPTNPDKVYSASEKTLAYSHDGGVTWFRGEGLFVDDFFTVAVDPNDRDRLYGALFWTLAMYRSEDGGQTWEWLPQYIHTDPFDHYPMAISIDPRDPDVVFVTGSSGLKGTWDGGRTWRGLISGLHLHGLARAPSNPDILYVGAGLGDVDKVVPGTPLFKSTDGGFTWREVEGFPSEMEINIYTIAVSPIDPDVVYVGTNMHDWAHPHPEGHPEGQGIFRSLDGGKTFQQVNDGLTERNVLSLAIDPRAPNVIYAGTVAEGRGSLFKSVDGGDTWQDISAGLPAMDVHGVALWPADPDVVLVALGQNVQAGTWLYPKGAGVWISEDGGLTWKNGSAGLEGRSRVVLTLAFSSDGSVVYAATDDGFYRGEVRGR